MAKANVHAQGVVGDNATHRPRFKLDVVNAKNITNKGVVIGCKPKPALQSMLFRTAPDFFRKAKRERCQSMPWAKPTGVSPSRIL